LRARAGAIYDRDVSSDELERLLAEMVAQQERKVLALARRIVPQLTAEDVRNPQDFAPLVESAEFNYEDGILAGLRAAEMAVRAAHRGPPKG
jgi:hypothetical protein